MLHRALRVVVTVAGPSILAMGCSSADHEPRAAATSVEEAIGGGYNDADDDTANVVVSIAGQFCSGTLITPRVVLTANHCVNGDNAGKPGMSFPALVSVGASLVRNAVGSVTGGSRGAYTVSNRSQAFTATQGPQTVGAQGNDLAILILDQFVLNSPSNPQPGPQPYIVHPTLLGPDSSQSIGQAGWSSFDSTTNRQVAFDSNSNTGHDTDDPGNGWNSWEHIQGSIYADPGDSGGPLFVLRTDARGHAYRDVFGVLSSVYKSPIGHDYDEYADITNQSPSGNAWLLSQLVDKTRTPKWMAQHPGYSWIGDVEYPGACDVANDADCDHWTNVHDNCPTKYNPDQIDTADTGHGDACTPVVTALSPPSGPSLRQSSVVITGANFGTTGNTQVLFGSYPATSVSCASSTQCTAVSPALGGGAYDVSVDVHVVVDGVTSATVPQDVFTFTAGPSCTTSLTCNGVAFGFPLAVAACSTTVQFFDAGSTQPLATGTTYTFDTNNVGTGALACFPNGSCSAIPTLVSDPNYCGAVKTPPPPATCNGVVKPTLKCSATWHCCGADGWECGVCQ